MIANTPEKAAKYKQLSNTAKQTIREHALLKPQTTLIREIVYLLSENDLQITSDLQQNEFFQTSDIPLYNACKHISTLMMAAYIRCLVVK